MAEAMSMVKGDSHSGKGMFFVNANKILRLSLVTHRSFSLLSAGFPYEIRLQRSPKFDTVAAILNSTQQPGLRFRDVIPSKTFCPNDFRQAF